MAQTLRAEVAKTFAVALEATFGTSVAPSASFSTFRFTPKIEKNIRLIMPSTYKGPTTAVGGKQSVRFGVHSDAMTYDEITYITETMIATCSPTAQSGSSLRIIQPSATAQTTKKSMTAGWGQTGDLWQANGCYFNKFSLKANQDGITFDGEMMGQNIQVGPSLGSLTQVGLHPILVEDMGVFTTSTFGLAASVGSAGGVTALDYPIETEILFDATVAPVYRLRQGEKSYAGVVEIVPGWKVNLTFARDQSGGDLSGSVWNLADWNAGTQKYVKFSASSQSQYAGSAGVLAPYELDFDFCLVVGDPLELTDFNGLSVVKYPCSVAVDSNAKWLQVTSVNKVTTI